jgi:hypothetical protein
MRKARVITAARTATAKKARTKHVPSKKRQRAESIKTSKPTVAKRVSDQFKSHRVKALEKEPTMAKSSKDYDSAPEADVLDASAPAAAAAEPIPEALGTVEDLAKALKHAQEHAGPITPWMIATAEALAGTVEPTK